MFFHSLEFALVFLPLSIFGYYLIGRFSAFNSLRIWYLSLISLGFYSLLGLEFFVVLILSLVGNFIIANILQYSVDSKRDITTKLLLFFGIAFNLGLLGYFKYRNFFIEVIFSTSLDGSPAIEQLIFPIGISFYTFIQIGYLLDIRAGISKATQSIAKHTLFAAFFPYVTAGPLVLYREIFPQLEDKDKSFDFDKLIIGFSFFFLGLIKKLLIADPLYPYVNEIFAAASFSEDIGMITAWLGALGYTLQLYFDFSGYCDMALGLGIIFGIYLPFNFKSPLKASSLGEFWRYWHITMTRFFTNYVFTPMSVKNTRASIVRGYGKSAKFWFSFSWPIVVTFTAAGIWHGAGWNFLIFGLLHGIGLSMQRAWETFGLPKISRYAGSVLTITFFTITLVFFRSNSVTEAVNLLQEMFSFDFATEKPTEIFYYLWLLLALTIALGFPNSQELFSGYRVSIDEVNYNAPNRFFALLKWEPTVSKVLILSVLAAVALAYGANDSPFIYYKF